jgi:hypothetical protein
MHMVRGNYSSCTCRSSENICSSQQWRRSCTKNDAFLSFTPLLKAIVLFCRFFFESHTRFWTKLRVVVLCFLLALRNTLMFVGVWTPTICAAAVKLY